MGTAALLAYHGESWKFPCKCETYLSDSIELLIDDIRSIAIDLENGPATRTCATAAAVGTREFGIAIAVKGKVKHQSLKAGEMRDTNGKKHTALAPY